MSGKKKSNTQMKNLLKKIQARDEEYLLSKVQMNLIMSQKDKKSNEYVGIKAQFMARIKKIKKLENGIKNQYSRLKDGSELSKRKESDKPLYSSQYEEVVSYVDKEKIKFYIPNTQGGGIGWMGDFKKREMFTNGFNILDPESALTVDTKVYVDDTEQDLSGYDDDFDELNVDNKINKELENIKKNKLDAKKAQMMADMESNIPVLLTPEEQSLFIKRAESEEERQEFEIIDIDSQQEIKTNNINAVIDNHDNTIAKPTLNPDQIDLNQAQINKNLEEGMDFIGQSQQQTKQEDLKEKLDDEDYKLATEFEKTQEAEKSRIGNLVSTEKRILEDVVPTYTQEISRGGESSFQAEEQKIGSEDLNKTTERLKSEISAIHLLFNDKIPLFKSKPHQGQKNDALKSNDIVKVRRHHSEMMNRVKEYFSIGGMKLGVIIDAQSYLNNQFGNISQIPLSQSAPEILERDPKKQLANETKRQINFKQTYIRGGMEQAKGEPIRNRIPAFNPHKVGRHRLPQIITQTNTIHPQTIRRSKSIAYTNINFKTRK